MMMKEIMMDTPAEEDMDMVDNLPPEEPATATALPAEVPPPPVPEEEKAPTPEQSPLPPPPDEDEDDAHGAVVDFGVDPEDIVSPEEVPLREEEVFGDVVGYGFSDDEMERYFRSPKWNPDLRQRKAPFLQPEQKAEREAFWKQVLTGDVGTIPAHIRKKLMGDAEQLTQEEEDYQICTAVNRSWAVDHLGVSRQEAQRAWPTYRKRLAKRLGVADKDEDVFLALSERESEKPLRKVAVDVYELAYKVGLEGRREYDLTPYLKDLDAYRADNVRGLATKAFEEGSATRRRYMPLAQMVKNGLKSVTAWESGVEGVLPTIENFPALFESVKQLGHLTREERNRVLHIVRSISPLPKPEDKNLPETMLTASRRGGVKMVLMLDQAIAQTSGAWMRMLGRGGGKSGKKLRDVAAQVDKYSIVVEELRRLAHYAMLIFSDSRWR